MLELGEKDLRMILALVHQLTGITIDASKKSMVAGRMRPLLKACDVSSLEEYLKLVSKNPEERQKFIDQVTTNETSFFRTPRIWANVKEIFLPEWHKENQGQTLKIWSAACSTGEEVYTLGMVCSDFEEKNPGFKYQIHATDINEAVLTKAKEAVYSGRNIAWIKEREPEAFKKHFSVVGEGLYKVSDRARRFVSFKKHNLFDPLSSPISFDAVFLRNVLIYFTAADQERVLRVIHNNLKDKGFLFIGESEALNRLNVSFKFKAPLVYEKEGHHAG